MNCPHCDKALTTLNGFRQDDVYNCFTKDHHYSIKLSNKSTYIIFYNSKNKYIPFNNFSIKCGIHIEDFSMFKGKTFKEIELLYNKMIIFQ